MQNRNLINRKYHLIISRLNKVNSGNSSTVIRDLIFLDTSTRITK